VLHFIAAFSFVPFFRQADCRLFKLLLLVVEVVFVVSLLDFLIRSFAPVIRLQPFQLGCQRIFAREMRRDCSARIVN
jgi:hypothetical protein